MNAPTQSTMQFFPAAAPEYAPSWSARLRLSVQRDGHRSILASANHEGPLRVQRPFYPEGQDLCHLYVLHPPGGLVSGDDLQIGLNLGKAARALVTTPSAGKVYRANERGTAQVQTCRLTLAGDASLEWLPQETILFDRASAVLETEIHLDPSSRLVAWDLVCLGRRESQERFESGSLRQRFSVWCNGVPLYLDHFALSGADLTNSAAWGLHGLHCVGNMIVGCGDMPLGAIDALVERLRTFHGSGEGLHLGITRLRSLIVVRLLGNDAETAKNLMTSLWRHVRPALLDRDACAPRIWNT